MLFQLFHILKTRYTQLRGLRLVREYARLGVLLPMVKAMAYAYAPRSLALVHHWGELFDKAKWQRLTGRVCFHKLTYMKDKVPVKVEGTYYEYVLNDNLPE